MQVCNSCKVNKDLTEYYKDGHGGLRKQCKACTTERDRQWREDNHDRRMVQKAGERRKNREYYYDKSGIRRAIAKSRPYSMPANHRVLLIDHYGEVCAKCNSTDRIEVDHVIPITWPNSEHCLRNSQLLCKRCNVSKGNRNDNDYRDWSWPGPGVLVGEGLIEWTI